MTLQRNKSKQQERVNFKIKPEKGNVDTRTIVVENLTLSNTKNNNLNHT